MTTYRVTDVPANGTIGQDCGTYTLETLPARLRAAVEADPDAGEWTLPALSDGDSGEELDDLTVRIILADGNFERYDYAVTYQGYTGTWEEWQAMDADTRHQYELGAAGIPTE
jgi:hypothetical protein